ncbi:MAG: hypothetical protein ACPGUD_14255 [Parashewanella sp.]
MSNYLAVQTLTNQCLLTFSQTNGVPESVTHDSNEYNLISFSFHSNSWEVKLAAKNDSTTTYAAFKKWWNSQSSDVELVLNQDCFYPIKPEAQQYFDKMVFHEQLTSLPGTSHELTACSLTEAPPCSIADGIMHINRGSVCTQQRKFFQSLSADQQALLKTIYQTDIAASVSELANNHAFLNFKKKYICPLSGGVLDESNAIQVRLSKDAAPPQTWITVSRNGLTYAIENKLAPVASITANDIRQVTSSNIPNTLRTALFF